MSTDNDKPAADTGGEQPSSDGATTRQRQSVNYASWVLGALLVAVGGAVVFVLVKDPTSVDGEADAGKPEPTAAHYLLSDQIGLAPIVVDVEVLRNERNRRETPKTPPAGQLDSFEQALTALHDAEIANRENLIRKQNKGLQVAVSEIYGAMGPAGVYGLMESSWDKVDSAVAAIASASRDLGRDPADLVRNPPEGLEGDVRWAAGLVLLARQTELMDARGQVALRLRGMLELLYRYRIALSLKGTLNPKELMTRSELVWLNMWRLHEAVGADPLARSRYIDRLKGLLPNYPIWAARGYLLWRHGDSVRARDAFIKQQELDPSLKPIMARWLRQIDGELPAPAPQNGDEAANGKSEEGTPATDAGDTPPPPDGADSTP